VVNTIKYLTLVKYLSRQIKRAGRVAIFKQNFSGTIFAFYDLFRSQRLNASAVYAGVGWFAIWRSLVEMFWNLAAHMMEMS
jgi:hypothetical protein